MNHAAMKKAFKIAGGPSALAKTLKISQSAVSQWRYVPQKRVLVVEKLTGVSRYELRPDIYGSRPEIAA